MKQIAPGVYDDGHGGMHVDLGAILSAAGYPDTPHNRAELERQFREYCARQGAAFHQTNEPLT